MFHKLSHSTKYAGEAQKSNPNPNRKKSNKHPNQASISSDNKSNSKLAITINSLITQAISDPDLFSPDSPIRKKERKKSKGKNTQCKQASGSCVPYYHIRF